MQYCRARHCAENCRQRHATSPPPSHCETPPVPRTAVPQRPPKAASALSPRTIRGLRQLRLVLDRPLPGATLPLMRTAPKHLSSLFGLVPHIPSPNARPRPFSIFHSLPTACRQVLSEPSYPSSAAKRIHLCCAAPSESSPPPQPLLHTSLCALLH